MWIEFNTDNIADAAVKRLHNNETLTPRLGTLDQAATYLRLTICSATAVYECPLCFAAGLCRRRRKQALRVVRGDDQIIGPCVARRRWDLLKPRCSETFGFLLAAIVLLFALRVGEL
jgi:hypothetical protein